MSDSGTWSMSLSIRCRFFTILGRSSARASVEKASTAELKRARSAGWLTNPFATIALTSPASSMLKRLSLLTMTSRDVQDRNLHMPQRGVEGVLRMEFRQVGEKWKSGQNDIEVESGPLVERCAFAGQLQ